MPPETRRHCRATPLVLGIHPQVDVRVLESCDFMSEKVLSLGAEFLEGDGVRASPAFESWL